MTARCDFSDLPVETCSHCTGRTGDEAPRQIEVVHIFTAHYEGRCPACDGQIVEGGQIAVTTDDEYICERCIP